ncbi:MAG: hypothetical protein ACLP7W_04260 [Solirubrobacteraceae bacterium]
MAVQPGPVDHGAARKGSHHEEEMPRVVITRRQAVAFGVFVVTVVGFLYFVLPKLAGVGTTLHHLEHGDVWWIAIGVVLELLSFAGYVLLFRAVFVGRPGPSHPSHEPQPIGWPESYQITMAGLAATRLFATAGAGGIALTAWRCAARGWRRDWWRAGWSRSWCCCMRCMRARCWWTGSVWGPGCSPEAARSR